VDIVRHVLCKFYLLKSNCFMQSAVSPDHKGQQIDDVLYCGNPIKNFCQGFQDS